MSVLPLRFFQARPKGLPCTYSTSSCRDRFRGCAENDTRPESGSWLFEKVCLVSGGLLRNLDRFELLSPTTKLISLDSSSRPTQRGCREPLHSRDLPGSLHRMFS